MKDNVLKKEFSKSDVQRVRNLVQGKYGDKTTQSVGYSKKQEFHKEGDIWEEDERTWTIKDGIKQNITKLDKAKKAHVMPMFCPSCKNMMKKTFDKAYYLIHQKCFDCVIKMESEIKREGKWEEYESGVMNDNKNAMLDDLEMALENWVEEKDTFVSESGEVEKWGGGDKTSIYKEVKEQIAKLKNEKVS